MALHTYILLVHFLYYTLGEDCVINNVPEYIAWEQELMKDLECGYSSYHPPSDNTTVKVVMFMKYFNFDSDEEVFTIQTLMSTKWKDERLKWDPEKYHGIKESDVSNFYIWAPTFELSNSEDFLNLEMHALYHYDLKNTGDVHGQHFMFHEAWCRVELTNWPYDVQECSLEFAPSPSLSRITNYTMDLDFIVEDPNGAEWYILDYKQVEDHSPKTQVKLTFVLMRAAAGLSAIVIYPALVLTILSVLSLYLDVRRKVRLAVACFSLLGHYFFLDELDFNIPKESNFPPTLLFYYRGSVILTVIIILLTFILAAMCKLKSTPHSYIKLINDFVYENNSRKYLVFPRWDFDDVTVDSKFSEDWVKFANVVNSIFMFFIVFAYIGLYESKIPKRTYLDKN